MVKNILKTTVIVIVLLLSIYSCEQEVSVNPPTTPVPLGKVIIQSEPEGATIYEDGRISGIVTPDTLSWLEERPYNFTLKKKYHKDTSFVIMATVDTATKIFVDYYKNPTMLGNVSLSSEPTGSDVYLHGEYIGTTPFSMTKVKPGAEYYVFKKDNHRTDSIIVPIYSSGNSVGKIELTDTTYWVDYSDRTSDIHDVALTAVAVDQNDVIWVGSKYGVSSFDGRNWEYYSSDNSGLSGMIINRIKVDNQNNKWFATDNGICKFNGSIWESVSQSTEPSFPDNWVEDIAFPEDGSIIVVTKDGMGRSSATGWKVIKFAPEVHDSVLNWFTGVAFNNDNDIWLTNKNHGLMHYDGSRLWEKYFPYESRFDQGNLYNCVTIADDAIWFGHIIKYYSAMVGLSTYKNNTFDKSTYIAFWGKDVFNITIKNGNEKWVASSEGLFVFDDYQNRKVYTRANTPLKTDRIMDVAIDSKGDAWVATYGAGLYRFKVTELK